MKLKQISILAIAFAICSAVAIAARIPARLQALGINDPDATTTAEGLPIANLNETRQYKSAEEQRIRLARDEQYEVAGLPQFEELPSNLEQLPLIVHWFQGLSGLPASKSDAVVVGEVVSASAYVTPSKSSVYSEWYVRPERTLKNITSVDFRPDILLSVARRGGAVRFESGRIQKYEIAEQGNLQKSRRYLLFLKYDSAGENFQVLTAYQLHGGKVWPVDGATTDLPFAKYKNVNEAAFLKAANAAIANPAAENSLPIEEGGRQ